MDLFAFVAREQGGDAMYVRDRFRLRYFSQYEAENYYGSLGFGDDRARVAQMLYDELDLPGQRLSKALKMWEQVVQLAVPLDDDSYRAESGIDRTLWVNVCMFIHDFGWPRLVEVITITHPKAAEKLFGKLLQAQADGVSYHMPALALPDEDLHDVAETVRRVLQVCGNEGYTHA